jgi:hypothetical protein
MPLSATRTTIITRQTLHHGEEQLAIVRSPIAYYVIHINAQQQCSALPDSQYWEYTDAHERLQQEFQERRSIACPRS